MYIMDQLSIQTLNVFNRKVEIKYKILDFS